MPFINWRAFSLNTLRDGADRIFRSHPFTISLLGMASRGEEYLADGWHARCLQDVLAIYFPSKYQKAKRHVFFSLAIKESNPAAAGAMCNKATLAVFRTSFAIYFPSKYQRTLRDTLWVLRNPSLYRYAMKRASITPKPWWAWAILYILLYARACAYIYLSWGK